MTTMWMVDSNAHATAPTGQRTEYPLRPLADAKGQAEEAFEPSVEQLVAAMDEAGVDQAFLIASRNHGFDSRYCADAGRRFPDRFVTIASVDVFSPTAVDDVRHWVEARGMHGVRLWGGRRGPATWIDDDRCRPVWQCIHELGIPANAQMTTPATLPATRRLLERLPELRLTVNNLGHVPADQGVASDAAATLVRLSDYPRVYVNMSVQFLVAAADPSAPQHELLDALLDSYGPERLLWSAFYPSPPNDDYPRAAAAVRKAVANLPEAAQSWICGAAAQRLYPALPKGV